MSKFIDASKHGAMTSAVTTHFFGNGNSEIAGKASGKGFAPGGDSQWNQTGSDFPAAAGVNYVPHSQAGHSISTAPFQGSADGMPGSAKLLWDK